MNNPRAGGQARPGGSLAATKIAAKKPADHETTADVIDYLCEQHGATYSIKTLEGGRKRVLFEYADDRRIVAEGATTAEAVNNLATQLGGVK